MSYWFGLGSPWYVHILIFPWYILNRFPFSIALDRHGLPPSLGCLLDVNLHHFSVTVPTSYRLKFTILRRENFWIWSWNWEFPELIWLLTWCKSAPLFSNCPDFLQIEIYYNKKHLFLVSLRFLDLGSGISWAVVEWFTNISWIQINLMLWWINVI